VAKLWASPLYKLSTPAGRDVVIDVTSSASAGLDPNSIVTDVMVPFLKDRGVRTILDFGAGALRHTLPLLKAGFEVCAVEFERGFDRDVAAEARRRAERDGRFTSLVWPQDYLASGRRFDAALLCYVLQTMPIPRERFVVLKSLAKKLKRDSYVLYMSRYNQGADRIAKKQRVSDGFFMWPRREEHSFYREFGTPDTHEMFRKRGFHYIRNLSQRGTDQVFLYAKGSASWV
jgi:hypothetical protein